MGQYLMMVNRQSRLLEQIRVQARNKAPITTLASLLRRLQAQNAMYRLHGLPVPLGDLSGLTERMLERCVKEGGTEGVYHACGTFSSRTIQQLEQQLSQAPEEGSALPEMIQDVRDNVRELMDWVVVLAGGRPAR